MSWTISLGVTNREDWDAAVDRAEAGGQNLDLPGVREDVEAAKSALKSLGRRVKRSRISGYASGHALQADEGITWVDSIAVSVSGVDGT